MLFFSNILNKKVKDQVDRVVGRLEDVAIELIPHENYPPIVGIVVQTGGGKKFIDSRHIESYNKNSILLNKNVSEVFSDVPDNQWHVFIRQSVLDKQIVDLSGIRVVRVNDLQFGVVKGRMSLVAIDIGKPGILRRLGLSFAGKFFGQELLEWYHVQLVGDKLQLSVGIKEIVKIHPADIANIVEKLNLNQGSELLQALDKKTAARVLEELEPEIQKILVENLGPERATSILQKMSINELVDLIQMLPDRKISEFVSNLPSESTQKVKKIIAYDENTAGGLMTTEYMTAFPENTAEETMEQIKNISQSYHGMYFVYVVDGQNNFYGVVSLRGLIAADKDKKLKELVDAENLIPSVKVGQDVLQVASLMTKYNLLSVAVLDDASKLLGVVTVDDIMRHFVPHA